MYLPIITARKRGLRQGNIYRLQTKFARLCFTPVCHSVQGGVCPSACWGTPPSSHPPRSRHPPGTDGYCCGWYASYWNAFLFHKHLSFCSRGGGMCAWGGICSQGVGACMPRGGVAGGRAWQERRPQQRAVCILLECILVKRSLWSIPECWLLRNSRSLTPEFRIFRNIPATYLATVKRKQTSELANRII